MGSHNYGVVIYFKKRKQELEEGIGFDWTLGYDDHSGYFAATRPINVRGANYIPDLEDIGEDPDTDVIKAGRLAELIAESAADHGGDATEGHEWVDWGNGHIGLAIEIGMTNYYVVPFYYKHMTIEQWRAHVHEQYERIKAAQLKFQMEHPYDPNVHSVLDDVEDL